MKGSLVTIIILAVAVIGLGIFAGVQTANLAKANEEIASLQSTLSEKEAKPKKITVSGKSIADACKALEDSGWYVESVIDSKGYHKSCADEGTVTSVYYYDSDGKVSVSVAAE